MRTPRRVLVGALSLGLAGWAASVIAVAGGAPAGAAGTAQARVGATAAAPRPAARPQGPALVDYERQVKSILDENCLECHSQDKRKGGLSLATYEDVLEGGRSGAVVRPGSSERQPDSRSAHGRDRAADAERRIGARSPRRSR